MHRGGDDVDPFINALLPEDLSAEDFLPVRREDQLDIQWRRVGIVAGVVALPDQDGPIIDAFGFSGANERFFALPPRRRRSG